KGRTRIDVTRPQHLAICERARDNRMFGRSIIEGGPVDSGLTVLRRMVSRRRPKNVSSRRLDAAHAEVIGDAGDTVARGNVSCEARLSATPELRCPPS